jgi:hypothetical protein
MTSQSGQSRPSQPWSQAFGPLFRGSYSDQHLRVSDAERQAVTDRLAEHFSAGRLDQAEFDERVGRAMSAKTRADLNGLFDDLPGTGAPAAPASPDLPRRRRRHPILAAVLVVIVALMIVHATWWATWPLLWIGFLVVAVLFANRTVGHRHASEDR